ncbi:hypothetical protein HDU76_012276, partial [Blyttiomyces sp. JEL0837]
KKEEVGEAESNVSEKVESGDTVEEKVDVGAEGSTGDDSKPEPEPSKDIPVAEAIVEAEEKAPVSESGADKKEEDGAEEKTTENKEDVTMMEIDGDVREEESKRIDKDEEADTRKREQEVVREENEDATTATVQAGDEDNGAKEIDKVDTTEEKKNEVDELPEKAVVEEVEGGEKQEEEERVLKRPSDAEDGEVGARVKRLKSEDVANAGAESAAEVGGEREDKI